MFCWVIMSDGSLPWLNAVFSGAANFMLKWLLTLVVAIFLLGIVTPHVARFIRFGQLPGDFRFRFRGRDYRFPFVSILLFSALLWLIGRLI